MGFTEHQRQLAEALFKKAVQQTSKRFEKKLAQVKRDLLHQTVKPNGSRFRVAISQVLAHHAATLVKQKGEAFFKVINDCDVPFDGDIISEINRSLFDEACALKEKARKSELSDPLGAYEALIESSVNSAVQEMRNEIDTRRLMFLAGSSSGKPESPPITNISVTGPNARVNLGSIDNSSNTTGQTTLAQRPISVTITAAMFRVNTDESKSTIHLKLRLEVEHTGLATTFRFHEADINEISLKGQAFPFFSGGAGKLGPTVPLEPGYAGLIVFTLSMGAIHRIEELPLQISGYVIFKETFGGLLPKLIFTAKPEACAAFTRTQESHDQSSPPTAKEPDRFIALEELAGQLVEELSSYRPLDREFLAPLFDEFRRAPGKFVRYPEVRKVTLDLQNALDRMFAAKRDHEDGQPELRDELDAELKELLTACDQARKITSEHSKITKDVRNGELPANQPKIRPVSYDRQNEENSKVGLSIANDGEPAYDISIPDIQFGEFRIKMTPHFTRLSKEDGTKFCEASMENRKGTIFPGEMLLQAMHLRNVSSLPFQIRFRDTDGNWYVTTCSLYYEARMVSGISSIRIMTRFERQDVENLKANH